MTHNSFKKGPGYVLTLLKYLPPQKRTKPQYTIVSKKDQAGWWCWVETSLNVSNSKISPIPTLLKFLPKTLISHADNFYRLRIVLNEPRQEPGAVDLGCQPSRVTFCIRLTIEGGGCKLLGFIDALLDAATDPSGLGFLQSRTILHRSEHPQQPFSCFFVGIAAADLVDVDSGSGETDGFGGHGGGFAYKQSRGSMDVMHLFDRNMYTIGFKIGR